jgi:polar amino acid transport system substrate-binding protein
MKTIIKSLFTISLVLLISIQVNAQSKLSKITKSGVIKVGMTGNQPPFSMASKDGSLMGFEVDLAEILAESMKLKLEIVQMPFKELLPALEKGSIDVIMSGMTITTERNLKVPFVGPYVLSGKSILTKSASLAKAQEAEDLNQSNLKITALNGSTSEKFVSTYLKDATFIGADNYDVAVENLLEDRANVMVADFPVCMLTMLRYPEAELATLSEPLTMEPIGIAVAPKDPLFLNFIQNYFNALKLAGELDRLETYWFQDGSWLAKMK